ncbi:SCP2 sterol-binding domain-containing protein [Pendulispora albinea]|uniref:SCP2 sterol-binding domain-containing protein n=1 Tax=Pendulispora albinea TaxID=2741071 RepID=A0ABZ2M1J4_9BACT
MLPNFVPAGTSVESFFEQVLPDAHRALVPADASAGELAVGVHIEGAPLGSGYFCAIRGREISVKQMRDEESAHLWLTVDAPGLAFFLDDLGGERRFAPSFVPAQGVKLITDPRILKRLVQASGTIELRLLDLEIGRKIEPVGLRVSAAGGKKHGLKTSAADAEIETKVSVFEKLLAGKLAPDEAIADSHVAVRGKKLVAMQFAFALAPFFPKP